MNTSSSRSSGVLQDAIKAHQAGRLAQARLLYEKALAKSPRDPDALHFLGVLRHNLGQSVVGIELIQRSLGVAPGNPHAWLNLGNIFLENDRTQEALDAYQRVSRLAPELADGWYNLGICLRKLEDAPGAVAALDRALAVRPAHAASFYQRGIARRDGGDETGAEADFRAALQLQPGYVEVYESLGLILYKQDRIADAARMYGAWLAQDPSSSTALHMAAAMSGAAGRGSAMRGSVVSGGAEPESGVDSAASGAAAPGVAAVPFTATPERASTAYVTEVFDRFAPTFDENLGNLDYRAPQLVIAALADLAGRHASLAQVLDAGCGTGLCGAGLRLMAQRLVGVDLSPAMIERARAKGHYDELHVRELCEFMRFHPAEFDAIVASDTLNYFGVLDGALESAAACLKPQGLLVVTLEEMAEGGAGVRGAAPDYRLEPHGRYSHRIECVRAALERAGFEAAATREAVLRRERGEAVRGVIVTARSLKERRARS